MCEKYLSQKGDSRRQSRKVWKEENAREVGSVVYIIHSFSTFQVVHHVFGVEFVYMEKTWTLSPRHSSPIHHKLHWSSL